MTFPWPRLRPWLRVILWTLAALALFELAWISFFSWAAGSGRLRDWSNRRPEKVRLEYASVSSLWPGLIEIDGLVVRGRTANGIEWQVEADRVRAQLALLPLLGRRLIIRGAQISGVEVRSLSPATEEEGDAPRAAARSLRPMTGSPGATTALGGGERRRRRPSSRWTFEFRRLHVAGVRTIVVDDSELSGEIEGELGFAVRSASGEGEIFASRVEIGDLLLRHRGDELGRELAGTLELRVAPYRYREERGRALLPHTSGRLQLRGQLDDRPVLAELLRRAPWISVEPGVAPFVADLRIERGRLRAGSRIEAPRAGRNVRTFDFTIEGPNALSLVVDRDGGVDRARWQVGFESFTLRRDGIESPLLEGQGLAVVGVARPPDLADLAAKSELRLELGKARAPDLGFLVGWLPAAARIEHLAGSGEVSGALSAQVDDLRPGGAVEARFDDVRLRWGGLDFAGRVEMKLAVAGGDFEARRLDVGGTRLLLADFAAPDFVSESASSKWWMQLLVDGGSVSFGPPLVVESRFQTRLRDTAPLVALFETRRDLPRWAERLLTEEDLRATGRLRAGPEEFEIERIDTELLGGKLSMRLRFAGEERQGKLLLAWRRLALGAGFEGDRRELHLSNAREWFGDD